MIKRSSGKKKESLSLWVAAALVVCWLEFNGPIYKSKRCRNRKWLSHAVGNWWSFCPLRQQVPFLLFNKVLVRWDGTHTAEAASEIWAAALKWLLTVVHISADGFVRWTAVYKHIPEVRGISLFPESADVKISDLFRLCRMITALWTSMSLTPGALEMPTWTHGFFIVRSKLPRRLPLLSPRLDASSGTALCGCTWCRELFFLIKAHWLGILLIGQKNR